MISNQNLFYLMTYQFKSRLQVIIFKIIPSQRYAFIKIKYAFIKIKYAFIKSEKFLKFYQLQKQTSMVKDMH